MHIDLRESFPSLRTSTVNVTHAVKWASIRFYENKIFIFRIMARKYVARTRISVWRFFTQASGDIGYSFESLLIKRNEASRELDELFIMHR